MTLQSTGVTKAILVLSTITALTACGSMGNTPKSPFATLDGKQPLVVAHRGASGYLPEETLEAYARAIELGADVIEMDLVVTKDGVLVARHDPNLAISTDVAKHPEFASRKKTMQVDGETQTGWFVQDLTLAEVKSLGGISTDAERPQQFNGQFKIPTFQEVIDFAKAKSRETGRTIAIYPETKNPTWNNAQAIANGCGAAGSRPLEDALIKIIGDNGLNTKDAPILVQSFEPGSLKYMRSHGLQTRQVQLVDGNGIDFKTGKVLLNNITNSRPFDWTVAGDARLYDAMLTPEGLAEIKTYADGIGPWKAYIVPLKIAPWKDSNADGTPYKGSTPEASTQDATSLVADAHKLGLFVHVFTFRNEKKYLAADYRGDPSLEYLKFYRLGVDGVFSDFTHTGVAARAAYLRELGW